MTDLVYLDTSVALAHLLAEDRVPPAALWSEALCSSRLLEYELWIRVQSRSLYKSHGEQVRALLGRLALLELEREVLARAIDPFPTVVRTLDALHLASVEFLRAQSQKIALATYDSRMSKAASALGIPLYPL